MLGGDFDPHHRRGRQGASCARTGVRSNAATIATAEVRDPGGYGRVIRDGGRLVRIVEHADATPAERAIREVWLVATVFRREDLFGALPLVGDDNRQHEYYLNDVFPILLDKGERIAAVTVDTGGAMGLNSRGGLAAVTRVVRDRINAAHMANGVTLLDPDTTYIDVGVKIAPDTTIGPNTTIEGETRIGRDGRIGPSVQIRDAMIGDGATIRFAVVEEARLARNVTVGPFARIRPGTTLADNVIVGSYVEVKNADIGTDAEGAAPVLRRGRHRGEAHEHRGGQRDGELGRVSQTSDHDRRRCADRLGYDHGCAGYDRRRRDHGSGLGDQQGRAGRCARRRADGATDRQGYRKRKDAQQRARRRAKGD